ncbi:LPS O-antigen chain length determinant protein WzzB [Necropsobacter massiliensis]|uniref:LPS O-antigen chain length determinant protein WzzB n=1 Tax=Necropsobacter massiliensis TaxID=1400001 RepID=UPI0006614250|nr:LPS O-antigen chain length determinant protein WzzB [Necropsobacter massiliensis]
MTGNPCRGRYPNKRIILLFLTALLALGGYAGSYSVNPLWTAEAEIAPPTTNELGNYASLFSMYQLISGEHQHASKAADMAYQEFKRQLSAYDNINAFWQHSEYYKQQLTGNHQTDGALLRQLMRRVQVTQETAQTPLRISIALENPKQATELLTAFIQQTNDVARTVVYNELISQWKILFNQINTATQLNLGQTGQHTDGQDWQGKLNMMKSVTALDNTLIAYRYTKTPSQPVHADYPNRALWAAIGAGVGIVLGLLIILLLPTKKED